MWPQPAGLAKPYGWVQQKRGMPVKSQLEHGTGSMYDVSTFTHAALMSKLHVSDASVRPT